MNVIKSTGRFLWVCFWIPLLILAAFISNRVDGSPDIAGRDNRAFKWLPWGRNPKKKWRL